MTSTSAFTDPDEAVLRRVCHWLFIPKGPAPGRTGKLRMSARLVIPPELELRDAEVQALGRVFADWPAFLASTTWNSPVRLAVASGTMTDVREVGSFSPRQTYLAALVGMPPDDFEAQIRAELAPDEAERLRRAVQARSQVWRAAFPDPVRSVPLDPPPPPDKVDAQPTADAAASANKVVGGLHALSVASSLDDVNRPVLEAGTSGFNFGAPQKEGLSEAVKFVGDAMSSMASFALGPASRGFESNPSAPPSGLEPPDPVVQWAADTGAESGSIQWKDHLHVKNPEARPILKMLASTAPDSNVAREALKNLRETRLKSHASKRSLKVCKDMQLIAHHGWLLRYLGLAVDFEVPLPVWDELQRRGSQPRPQRDCETVVVVDPTCSHPQASPGNFQGKPRGFPQYGGVLNLASVCDGSYRFALVQLDVHGAVRKFMQMTAAQRSQADGASEVGDKRYETSSQVSAGITLVDRQAKDARASLGKPKCDADGFTRLFAEDITIGIRPDVQSLWVPEGRVPVQSAWKSLTGWKIRSARVDAGPLATADITQLFAGVDAGEAIVGSTHRVLASDAGGGIIIGLAAEEMFTWKGWSLAVGHPDPGGDGRRPAYTKLEINQLVIQLESDGDLPALRYGHGYRVAARAVYADAGGLSLDAARETAYACSGPKPFAGLPLNAPVLPDDDRTEDTFAPYMRFEPLAPPDIHLAEKIDYADFPQAAARKVVLSTSSRPDHVRRREVRYIVPPPISLEQAITLGAYDSRERRARPPESAFKGVCLTREGRFPNASNSILPSDIAGRTRRSSAGDGSDTIFHRSLFARDPVVPYLPDPWARRVIIGVFRASDSELLAWEMHDYYGDGDLAGWPHCNPLRLEVVRAQDRYVALPEAYGSAAGHVDIVKQNDRIQLVVPAGENLQVRFWHEMDERMLSQSAIVDQMAEFLQSKQGAGCAKLLNMTGCLDDKARTSKELVHCLSQWQELRHTRIRAQISRTRARGLTNVTSFGMINPSETLDVVHAVDRPAPPSFLWSGQASEELEPNVFDRFIVDVPARRLRTFEQSFRFRREPARSDATLAGDIEFDRATTQRIDIRVDWEDIDDDPAQPAPVRSRKNAILGVDGLKPILSRPDGLARHVPNARLTPDVPDDNNLLLLDGVRTRLHRVDNEDLRDRNLQVSFGDPRARVVDLTVTGQSRFAREYPERSGGFQSLPGYLKQVVCPASASPARVDLDYIIPRYEWLSGSDSHQAHERLGGCFRVWLRRPWFTSGPDERLAVVCWPGEMFDKDFAKRKLFSALADICRPNSDPPQFVEPLLTRWGLDPVFQQRGAACLGPIPPEAFRRHVCDVDRIRMRSKQEACFPVVDLRMCEAVKASLPSYAEGDSKVALVLYEPQYDATSRRWYVDIQMDEKYAYYPFVRLALARYQAYALPGFELSDITLQEFVQLPPGRRTRLTVKPAPEKGQHVVSVGVRMSGQTPGTPREPHLLRTRVGARLEYLPLATWQRLRDGPQKPGFHEVAWVPDGNTVDLVQAGDGGWDLRPSPESRTGLGTGFVHADPERVYSVVIEEFEIAFQDDIPKFVQAGQHVQWNREDPPPPVSLARRVFRDRLLLTRLA